MDVLFGDFADAQANRDGYQLSRTLSPDLPHDRLRALWKSCNAHDVKNVLKRNIQNSASGLNRLSHDETQGWVEVYYHYWKAVGELLALQEPSAKSPQASWTKVYEVWRDMLSGLIRGYNNHGFEAWTIPCLYVAGKHLRVFAIRADKERNNNNNSSFNAPGQNFQDDFDPESEQAQQLEDCARQLNRIFNLCLSDRAPLEESRKWGIYYVINLLFKTYFKLNSASLSKNILKALSAGRGDMPPLSAFPKSQQVTFKYYEGVLNFLEENYLEAEKHLTEAWGLCHRNAMRNKEMILTYLVPCHLITTHTLPTQKLLEPYPRLQKLFLPLSRCIKKGELHAFDLALQEGEDEFVKRRIYLTLERGRDVALRNLLRKVFIAGGFVEPAKEGEAPARRTRVPIAEFAAAISLGSQETIDDDEVECFLANMIYKGLMKGYIAREHGKVVLSKNGAFPGTGV
ncbi:COP9 signalosome complex subunit 12 [Diplogelasinospora grovesii]|uniref:Protein CSN12 homolog n=1 Tax=Diplogelasinospora grovesii TaxID=303347 RepID=A0AAN6NDE0_9PEZI|nr:COP9 signalosome complex subunit 12 [Diplogelasinospora grovesii]